MTDQSIRRLPTPPSRPFATGLRFPEGPIAMPDGSVLAVEVKGGTLARCRPGGVVDIVAELNPAGFGGANGAAVGPDGAVYVCNNGGFYWSQRNGLAVPTNFETGSNIPDVYEGGWINRVELDTGRSSVLYRECVGARFTGPNDIVFDSAGGFWFTDLGKSHERTIDKGGVYYARIDGSRVERKVWPMWTPNGVGLSPDESTLYVAESMTGRLWAFDLTGPGTVKPAERGHGGRCLANTLGHFDSLAVEAGGNIVVAAIGDGLCVVTPDGSDVHYVTMPDPMTTNVCFGGPDRRTAYVTLSGSGQLLEVEWPRPGLTLAY
jgi:gluconolactonase